MRGLKYKQMKKWIDYIEVSPEKLYGKPVIKGTRIPVDLILAKLAEGDTITDLLEAYPQLTKVQIQACLHFASESIRNEVIHAIAG